MLKSGCRLLLIIMLVLALLGLYFLATEIFQVTSNALPQPDSDAKKYCTSSLCKNVELNVLKSLDTSYDPCDNLYNFACKNYKNSFYSPDLDENKLPTKDMEHHRKIILNKIFSSNNEITTKLESYYPGYTFTSVQKFYSFYKSCEDEREIAYRGTEHFKEYLRKTFDWPNFSSNHSLEYVLAKALLQTSAFFKVQVSTSTSPRRIQISSTKLKGITLQKSAYKHTTGYDGLEDEDELIIRRLRNLTKSIFEAFDEEKNLDEISDSVIHIESRLAYFKNLSLYNGSDEIIVKLESVQFPNFNMKEFIENLVETDVENVEVSLVHIEMLRNIMSYMTGLFAENREKFMP